MPKIILGLFFVLTSISFTTAQPLDSIRLNKLQAKLEQLEEKLFINDSVAYANEYNVVYEGYFLYDKLSYMSEDFYKSIKNESFLIELLNVNNPNTLDLQKRILQEVQQLVEGKVFDLLGKDSTKKKGIFKTIRNIFNNPIVSKVASFIPFTNTISSIIGTISGIVDADVDIVQNTTRKIIEKTINIKSIFENSPLSELSAKIVPYMQFYDSLAYLNNKFSIDMDILKNKAAEIANYVNEQKNAFKTLSGWDPQKSMLVQMEAFDKLFIPAKQVRNNPKFNAEQIARLHEFYLVAAPVIKEYKNFARLRKEYDAKFLNMRKDYTALLERFKNKNKIFADVLSNTLTSIQKIDKVEDSLVTKPDAMVLSNIAPPQNAQEERQLELQMKERELWSKYAIRYEEKVEKIKKAVF